MRVPTAREFFFSAPPRDGHEHEQRQRAFFHAIRLRNGTNKTTYAHRLDTVNAALDDVLPARRPLDIMDVGVSSGISTLEWMDHLDAAGVEYRLTAGDVCLNADLLRVANWLHILIDREGYPLQFDVCGRAFPYPPGIRRGLLLPPLSLMMYTLRWVLPRVRAKRLTDRRTPVRLVDSRLHGRAAAVVEDDVLAPQAFEGSFDVVRAANVLNRCYFSDETLARMAGNLCRRLKCGGILVICRTDEHGTNHGTVFRSNGSPGLEVVFRIGNGSEIEKLVLRSVP